MSIFKRKKSPEQLIKQLKDGLNTPQTAEQKKLAEQVRFNFIYLPTLQISSQGALC